MAARLARGTWVLIADGEKALVLENQTDHENPYLTVLTKEEQENPPDRDQSANQRGRFNDGPSVQRSAVEDTDWHQLAKDRFADDLNDLLYKRAHQGAFSQLVIVASPGVLGQLRSKMHQEVGNRVIAEVPKTLTNHGLDDIEKIVRDELERA
jgi:protein required for attachment to host cells